MSNQESIRFSAEFIMLTTAAIQTIISGISVATGFLLAFIADPIKSFLERRLKRERLRSALYAEIISIHSDLKLYVQLKQEEKTQDIDSLLSFPCGVYQLARQDLLLFYELKESALMSSLYRNVNIFSKKAQELDNFDSVELAKQILLFIETCLRKNGFKKKALLRASKNATPSSNALNILD